MIDRLHDASALSLLVANGLPDRTGTITGQIERIGRFDERSGEIAPLGALALPAGSTVYVSGWSADLQAKGPVAGICIRYGSMLIDAHYGERRDDVGAVYGGDEYSRSGFHAYLAVDQAARGELMISAIAVGADARSSAVLAGGRTLTVVAAAPSLAFTTPRRSGSAVVNVDSWHVGSNAENVANEEPLVPRGSIIALRGWARDAANDAPASGVFAVLDEHDVVRGNAWQPRADVVAVMRRDDLLATGFTIRIDTDALAPGRHAVQVGIVTADGEAYDVDERRFAFEVTPDHR